MDWMSLKYWSAGHGGRQVQRNPCMYLVLSDDLPDAAGVGMCRHPLIHHAGSAIQQRSVREVGVASDPPGHNMLLTAVMSTCDPCQDGDASTARPSKAAWQHGPSSSLKGSRVQLNPESSSSYTGQEEWGLRSHEGTTEPRHQVMLALEPMSSALLGSSAWRKQNCMHLRVSMSMWG